MSWMSEGPRKVRARVDGVGSFTKGNRNGMATVRTTALRSAYTPGFKPGSDYYAVDPYATPKPGAEFPVYLRKKAVADPSDRRGKVCPACGLTRSMANRCDCNS